MTTRSTTLPDEFLGTTRRRWGRADQAVRVGPRSALVLTLASVAGLMMFGWPLLVRVEPQSMQHGPDAPFVFIGILPVLIVVVLAELSEGGMDAKALAMLISAIAPQEPAKILPFVEQLTRRGAAASTRTTATGRGRLCPSWRITGRTGRCRSPGSSPLADARATTAACATNQTSRRPCRPPGELVPEPVAVEPRPGEWPLCRVHGCVRRWPGSTTAGIRRGRSHE